MINEYRILKLEKIVLPYQWAVPGTSISRVRLDNSLLERHGLDMAQASDRGSTLVWCLALGPLMDPKAMFYGYTIEEAVTNAETRVEEVDMIVQSEDTITRSRGTAI